MRQARQSKNIIRTISIASALASLCLTKQVAHGAPINFRTPQNITGDTDVLNVGSTLYAVDWANISPTINGVSFTGTNSATGSGNSNLGLTISSGGALKNEPPATSYTSTSYPFAGLSSNYKTILAAGDNDANNGTHTITVSLNNLTVSHVYAVQVWENDPRPKAGRFSTVASVDPGGNSQAVQYSALNVAGSPGQYTIGGFIADGTSNSFTDLGSTNTQLNVVQVRDVTGAWSGAVNGIWDNSTANFTAGNNFSTVAGLVNAAYFGDTDGFGNPITNSAISIQNGGISAGSVVFQNNTVNYSVTSTDSNGIFGTGSLLKTGSGMLTLSGSNTYSGGTTLNAGITQFNSGAVPSSGQITINSPGILNAAGAYNTVTGWLSSGSIASSSTGVIALTGDSSEDINMGSYASLFLGATTNANYSGTLTPPTGQSYRLGGGGGMLTISSALTASNGLIIGSAGSNGTVVLSGSNSYTGGTSLVSGTLSVAPTGTLGSNTSGNNITIGAGLNLLLSAAGNVGSNQQIIVNTTTSAVGGIGVSYTPASLPAFNDSSANGGVYGINYTGNGGVTSMATLDAAAAGGSSNHWFLGSQSNGTFTGSLAAASDGKYRLGGGGGSLTINGTNTLTGSTALIINQALANGAGTVILAAPQNFTGGTTINAGTLNINSDSALGSVPSSATTNITFAAPATLQFGAEVAINANRNIAISSGTATFDTNGFSSSIGGIISGAAGAVNVVGGGTLTFTGANTYAGPTTVSSGALTYGGAASSGVTSNTLYALNVAPTSGVATVNINTSGTLNFGNATVGGGTGASAINQTSGTVSFDPSSNYVFVGNGGYGAYMLSGGTLNTGPNASTNTGIKIGYGGLGVYTETNGTLNVNRYFILGTLSAGGNGVGTFTGGTASLTNGAYNVDIGDAASAIGVMNIGTEAGGMAVFNTGSSPSGIQLTDFLETSGSGTINLNSGTINIQGGPITKGGSATSTAIVNLNGGTLQAGILGTVLIDNTPNSVTVYNGGLIVDSQNNNTEISANLAGAAGNGIYASGGAGNLPISQNGGSGYIGAPLVTVTGGSGTGATAIANISNGVVTGVTLTNPGQNYATGDNLTFTFAGGGATTAAANYNYTLTTNDLQANQLGGLTKISGGMLTLSGINTYRGPTIVNGGVLYLPSAGNLPTNTSLTIASGATVLFGSHSVGLVVQQLSSLNIAGSAGAWTGSMDLSNNDLIVHNGSLSDITSQISQGHSGHWTGSTGITSSAAAGATNTALAVEANNDGNGHALMSTFDGQPVTATDILVKYTYAGDADLSGFVDGSDYTLIDNGFNSQATADPLTGWRNGDFNYDGIINGDDYMLIDNSFNTEGTTMLSVTSAGPAELVAANTSQIAEPSVSSVPEPTAMALSTISAASLLIRRRRRT